MKNILTLFLLFISLITYCQIELEHIYPEGLIRRTSLENSGEKYFGSNEEAQCLIYNADHSLWKTIDLPVPEDANIISVSAYYISEIRINPDSQVEVSYSYIRTVDGMEIYECSIVNENGSVLLTVEGTHRITLDQMEGHSDKLIAHILQLDEYVSEVYSLPDPILEHEYSGRLKRINLENSGEKYYIINPEQSTGEIYNSDHTAWKTINLITTPGHIVTEYDLVISETMVNTDDLLEVSYRTVWTNSGSSTYTFRIINENNEVLFTVEDCSRFNFSQEEGSDDKLLVNQIDQSANWKVYSLPDLSLEHTYNGIGNLERIKFETLGEKYYFMHPLGESIELFNADHTTWMSIDAVPGKSILGNLHISETKIDPNEQIEIIYSHQGDLGENEVFIINQDGEILLNVIDGFSPQLSEIPGLENKVLTYFLVEPVIVGCNVFSLPSSEVGFPEREFYKDLSIYPNPTSGYITLNIGEKLPKNIEIYSIEGKLISEIKNPDSNLIDVSFLSSGLYLLVGKEGDEAVFSEKFVVE